ncbi:MAG: threonylcarbamoyl-AMP synthase [Oscillospiraceae bacterium]|nr:threonylcarbamoyl-AMP synthase [Oscillospiraceae bacterium]
MTTEILKHDPVRAAEILSAGGLVAVPTETVYGLAANGLNAEAVQRIYDVKGRPAVKPLSLMVHDASWMDRLCTDVPQAARALAARFWPGPLTIVLPAKETIPAIVRAGGDTIGLRCPDHRDTLALIEAADLPLAAPSANPSGAPSPKTAEAVAAYFSGSIEAILDGGPCGVGTESTIADLAHTPFRILRQGALPEEDVWRCVREDVTVLGITGGTGCGKTTLLQALRERGALLLDADAVYYELLKSDASLLDAIETRFPGSVENGVLQRKKLGAQVFGDAAALADLNAITHLAITAEIERRLCEFSRMGGTLAAIDAIALIESGAAGLCDTVIGVTAPREARIERLIRREGVTREYAERRIDAQKPDAWYAAHCDRVIENNETIERFQIHAQRLIQEVLSE